MNEPTITISLKEFLDFATYNGLFDYITVTEPMLNAIHQADPSMQYTYREHRLNGTNEVYTLEGWIRESKRRQELEELCEQAHNKPIVFIDVRKTNTATKQDIAKRIQDMLERLKQ